LAGLRGLARLHTIDWCAGRGQGLPSSSGQGLSHRRLARLRGLVPGKGCPIGGWPG
jgi:hypothetical protein